MCTFDLEDVFTPNALPDPTQAILLGLGRMLREHRLVQQYFSLNTFQQNIRNIFYF